MSSRRSLTLLALALVSGGCAHPKPAPSQQLGGQRVVSSPSGIAFVSSDRDVSGLSGEIRFGGPQGRSALYLKFPTDWRSLGTPRQAFLSLSPREGSAVSDSPLTLEAWRVSADWQPHQLRRWSEKPSLAPPYARTTVTSSPARELRLDVTELIRFAAENPERDYGIAVIASGSDGPGATFSSGFAGGSSPRLELYLR
ncbi:MAG TPA: DNRLRE domain-containing protein [Polyangiaceae bacterium]|jgi:hypothetical protein|nr:DNRLRE domain-containing protein [Polyangiaceae bacterium]